MTIKHFDRRQTIFGWIVLALCFVLAEAMLLPALQMARVGGRGRSPCAKNVREITFAVTNFEASKQAYPGYQNYIGQSKGRAKIGSWVVVLSRYTRG